MKHLLRIIVALCFLFITGLYSQNVIIVVFDGARYSETFGSGDTYIKKMWNTLRHEGTIFTNFRNEGTTSTISGHGSIESGTWQDLPKDGSKRPLMPTIFEYNRKQLHSPAAKNYVISAKEKLGSVAYSTHPEYGVDYGATFVCADGDRAALDSALFHLRSDRPSLLLINFSKIDKRAHDGKWKKYVRAIVRADSLTGVLWDAVKSDPYYSTTTTLFVTNDHGRHDELHGGFMNHGDDCEGCRHIMLLMAGKGVPAGKTDTAFSTQIDIAPTIGALVGFSTPYAKGKNILPIPR